jgi:hypothetical protein
MAVTTDARALAAAGDGLPVGRRVHTVRHGQGKDAWSERLETAGVGISGLTIDDQYGTAEHGRPCRQKTHIPPDLVVAGVTAHRRPPEVRICRLRNQSAVGTRPPACWARR